MTKSLVNLYFQANPAKEDKQENLTLPLTNIKNQIQSYSLNPKIQQEINEIKAVCSSFIPNTAILLNEVNKYDTFTKLTGIKSDGSDNIYLTGALSSLPIVKRYETLKNNNNSDNNPFRLLSLGLLGVINLHEDLRDALSIFGKTEAQAPKDFFVRFKFFAGTSVENFLMKSKLGRWIFDLDKTLADTKSASKFFDAVGIENKQRIFSKNINYPLFKKQETVYREYVKLQGSLLKKTLLLTANRITVLGLIFLGLLEIPKIIDSVNKKDYKQIGKSAVTVTITLGTGALLSSFLAITAGTAGSVLGFGLGMFLGKRISYYLNSNY